MNLNLAVSGKTRNYIFAGGIVLTLIALAIASVTGSQQDKYYRTNYGQYQQALKMMGDQKYNQALTVFRGLDAESQNTYQVQYMEAYCAAQTGDFKTAAALMATARETRPALLQDPKYLERYGVILYQLAEYEPARLYLQESLKYKGDPGVAQEANQYLTEINKKSQTGGKQ